MIQREGYEFVVKLSRVNNAIARLYLVNQNKVQVDVPANISLRNLDDNTAQNHFQNSFFIAWVNSYALFDSVNNTELVRLTNKKQHAISGQKITEHRTYVNGVLIPAKKEDP
ncbi:hypothetical protein HK099_002159 [Clydaea vesicula]|uniref:Uncharacterized protein n=1 Tax=Clydaea vesicula TaxID=447962 RepID=A0AAD5UAM9_9FUNG|nr:hypothetical protein HK099_002159 [Clydaea vesicula]